MLSRKDNILAPLFNKRTRLIIGYKDSMNPSNKMELQSSFSIVYIFSKHLSLKYQCL